MKKDCWNENAKETPITSAESTKTDPPISGMLIQCDEAIKHQPTCTVAVSRKETRICSYANDFLIDSGAATSQK